MSQSLDRDKRTHGAARPKHPKYVHIRKHLLQQVRSGTFVPGEALPKERELAGSLDVSVGTLRHALRGLEDEGVIRRIRGKGTFVNSPQQRRARTKTNLFSLIIPSLHEDPVVAIIGGVERAAAAMDHQVVVSSSDNEISRQEELLREAAEGNAAGVVLVPTTYLHTPEQALVLRKYHIPLVFCNRAIQRVAAPLVTWPHVGVGRMVAEALLNHGHRRITSLADFADVFVDAVGGGIRQTLREHDIDTSHYRLFCYGERLRGQHARGAIRKALGELLSDEDRPTAIQCFNSFDAEQIYLLAGELGLKIPEDLSLIYFGSKRRESALAQRLTCVGADEYEIGVQACNQLAQMDAGLMPHESNHKIEIPLTFLPGETVGPPPRD